MFTFIAGLALAVNLGPMAPDAPAHEPQMAASGSTVAMAFGAGKGIYFSRSTDAGKTFTSPVKVAEAEIVPLTRHRGPRIAFAGSRIVIIAVVGKTLAGGAHAHGLPSDGDLTAWNSSDGGANWSKGIVINDVPAASTEGLHSLASDGKGNLFAAWLDKRGGRGTKLYGARSIGGGVTWSKNVLIYDSPEGTICECCHPSVAMDAAGRTLVMWRNSLGGSLDMYLTRSRDGTVFSKPEKLGTGTWPLNACPMDGGGIGIANGRVVTAWRRDHEIFLASPSEKEVSIGEGTDVSVAATPGGVYAVWSNSTGNQALAPGKKEPVILGPKGALPNVIALANGHALAAWEDEA
jgi:hypothetical protein